MFGIDGYLVRVEADSSTGMLAFAIIGLPDRTLNEARERVRAAIINSGFGFPPGRLLVNMAPADIRKEARGSICPSPLRCSRRTSNSMLHSHAMSLWPGELTLDGAAAVTFGCKYGIMIA